MAIPNSSLGIGNHYRYRAPAGLGLEVMTTLCLSGPASEEYFVGKFDDDGCEGDYQMAREILARAYDAVQIGAALVRYRAAADKLVTSPWAQDRIRAIAAALLKRGTLTATDIHGLG